MPGTRELPSDMVGKRVRGSVYVHASGRSCLSQEHQALLRQAEAMSDGFRWNVARLGRSDVTLLDYDSFDDDPFPSLRASLKIDLRSGRRAARTFGEANAPILHRKELLLPPDDARAGVWTELTCALLDAGAFADSHQIGRRKPWQSRLDSLGLQVVEHRLCRR